MKPRSRDRLLQVYVIAVTVTGAAILAASFFIGHHGPPLGAYPYVFLAFAALLLMTELKPMSFHPDGGVVTASWTFAWTLLFIAPLSSALLVASVGSFISDLVGSKSPSRAAFNGAQFALCLSFGMLAGSQVYPLLAVAEGEGIGIRWLLAATLAWTVSFLLNAVIISLVIALHQALPVIELLQRSLRVNMGMDGVLLALSPVFLLAGIQAPILVPLLLGTVILIFRSATVALSNRHEATHDQLTNVPNRRLFEDHTAMTLANASRTGALAAVIHVDLDGFKGINDRLGHHYGDEVLKVMATRLQEQKRPVDFIARLGGDEFVITLGSVDSRDAATAIARSFLDSIQRPIEIDGVPLMVGASLGLAMFPEDGENLHTLLNNADIAMYRAKSRSLGVQTYSTEDDSGGPSRLQLLSELAAAIDANQLEVYYQPKIDMPTGEIIGVEALVRWNHPVYGLVMPSWFIPQAEQTELMTPLTDKILQLASAQGAVWLEQGYALTISMNASARNLHDLRFAGRVQAILKMTGLDAKWLEVEITENTVMSDPVRASSVIAQLREIGVSLAIDDFGTGYSSLASLRTLTLDRIKIDRSFIAELDSLSSDITIVRSVVNLGKALGLVVVAEGIETEAVYEIVRQLGCDEFQGFLVSRPVPAHELEPLLKERARRLQPQTSRFRKSRFPVAV